VLLPSNWSTLQLVFTDIKLRKVYVTVNEGFNYTCYPTGFTPNRILFQSTLAPNSTDEAYNKYILGYDNDAQTVSLYLVLCVELSRLVCSCGYPVIWANHGTGLGPMYPRGATFGGG